ncbi:hypothetical protein QP181_11240 [Sphingomonas sp. LR55]
MTDETAHPDLYLLGGVSPALEVTLAERFTLHREDPPATTRAIVGVGAAWSMRRCSIACPRWRSSRSTASGTTGSTLLRPRRAASR